MQSELILIATSDVNWTTYLSSLNSILKRKPTQELDRYKYTTESVFGFLGTINELLRPGSHPNTALSDLNLLRHVSFTFLFATDKATLDDLIRRAGSIIAVTTASNLPDDELCLSVVSGDMQDWYFASLACCTGVETYELRRLFGSLILSFEAMGLGRIFEGCKKYPLVDKTFKLLERKA